MATTQLPRTIDALTPAWLTQVLREGNHIGDASVIGVEAVSVGQGVGILCRLARLTLQYDRPAPGAPASAVVKIPSADPQTRGMATAFKFYEREVRFYDELAARVSLPTPACYYGAFDAGSGDFVLLLEDLGGSRIGDQLASCSLDDARLALDELTKLHIAWWNKPELETLTWVPATEDPVNKAGLSLYPLAWPGFVERLGSTCPAAMLRTGEKLGAQAGAILERFSAGPRTLLHGDYRLDNLFFGVRPADPPLTVIDWQIAVRGVGTYDIGYFLTQSLEPQVRATHEMDILKRYHQALMDGGVQGYSWDQLLSDYRWTALFCFAYPVMGGGLGDLSNDRGRALAEAMMHRSAAAILDWKAGELLDE
jgi:hypothetical protein